MACVCCEQTPKKATYPRSKRRGIRCKRHPKVGKKKSSIKTLNLTPITEYQEEEGTDLKRSPLAAAGMEKGIMRIGGHPAYHFTTLWPSETKGIGLLPQIFVGKNAKAWAFWGSTKQKGRNINLSLAIIICKQEEEVRGLLPAYLPDW
jgi:hypothetical protein